ncbi:hypothetical protein C1645_732186 [Glomus cerebriforme]|uniref:Uncharacterized protein n=1 Tax=Glomus cerebriforme TaxID=658196 RepID=A0A397TSC4_9GLOM|nr:hypothetical protein C1645_732186 [Glomus cerebriforme]
MDELSVYDTKIANEFSKHLSEINASFTAELGRIYTELNNKLTAEIAKINTCEAEELIATRPTRDPYKQNERSSGNVLNFWTTIEKKRYGDRIGIARADGVLRMLEGTTAGQQHVFNIQQQDLLGLYQSGDNDLTDTSMMSLSNILNHPGKRKSEGDHQPKTPPMRPRKVTVTTPEKPSLYKHTIATLG